jgi:DUF177 domain-containing protein
MPGAATRGLEVLRLAQQGARLAGDLEWDALPRLSEAVSATEGEGVRYSLAFTQQADGGIRIDGECGARVVLRCQRCMGDLTQEIGVAIHVAIADGDEDLQRLEQGVEPIELGTGGKLELQTLLEDELLLALPLVPMHEQADCRKGSADEVERGEETHRPFAALDELIRGFEKDPDD